MNSTVLASIVCAGLLGSLIGCQQSGSPAQPQAQPSAGGDDRRISGPFSHKNLTVFLIHGPDKIKGDNYLTLGEAMEQKKLVVYETDNVNELAIENVSDQPVFIQSGDIVKGGKQDRCLGTDVIVAARSGRMPIAAFCVEAGRWQQRGGESHAYFDRSDVMVVGNSMKLASNSNSVDSDQGRVWQSVSENQTKLSGVLKNSVASETSPSSFQLAMENESVQKNADEYTSTVGESAKRAGDAIGYAVVINGKITSADVYGSHALFMKVWPKLLKSSAVEALAELKPDAATPPTVSADEVRKFLDNAESAKAEKKQVNYRTAAVTYDCPESVMVQTDDTKTGSASVRRSYINKAADK